MFDTSHINRIAVLFVYFAILGFCFYNYTPGYVIFPILLASAVVWFIIEYLKNKRNPELVKKALVLGFFLMIFDFIVENIGAYLNLWKVTVTAFHVIAVPIEVMVLCVMGGAAWALSQPKKFIAYNAAADILLFATFGAIGEFVLIKNNVMYYAGWWNSTLAFIGYFTTWIILHWAWNKTLRKYTEPNK